MNISKKKFYKSLYPTICGNLMKIFRMYSGVDIAPKLMQICVHSIRSPRFVYVAMRVPKMMHCICLLFFVPPPPCRKHGHVDSLHRLHNLSTFFQQPLLSTLDHCYRAPSSPWINLKFPPHKYKFPFRSMSASSCSSCSSSFRAATSPSACHYYRPIISSLWTLSKCSVTIRIRMHIVMRRDVYDDVAYSFGKNIGTISKTNREKQQQRRTICSISGSTSLMPSFLLLSKRLAKR